MERERLLKSMRQYFNLCWEELHLYKSGKIDLKTWEIWAAGIRDTLRSPFFWEAWNELRPEYGYGGHARAFLGMIDEAVSEARRSVGIGTVARGRAAQVDPTPGLSEHTAAKKESPPAAG